MKTFKFRGEWKGKSAGGCLNHTTWRYNPQLFLTIKNKLDISISLTQENEGEPGHIGFYVARSDGSGRRQLSLSRDQLIAKAPFEDSKTVSFDLSLDASNVPYIVIPCTFYPKYECKFTMTFTAEGQLGLEPLSPSKEWKHVSIEGEWAGKTAGGCKNNSTCPNNPQFLVQVAQETNVHLLLSQADRTDFDHIGFYVAKTTASPSIKLLKLSTSDIVGKSEFASCREAYWNGILKPESTYVVIPCTFDPGWESKFALTILTDHPIKLKKLQEAKDLSLEGFWKGDSAGGCINHWTWRHNPQYLLTVKKDTAMTITLKQNDQEDVPSIGFYVTKGNGRKLLVLKPEELVGKGAFEKRKSVSVDLIVKAASFPYVIIPCTFYPAHENGFQISAAPHTNSSDVKLKPCLDNIRKAIAHGQWVKGKTAGGCRNYKSWLSNPQFCMKLRARGSVVIVLTQQQGSDHVDNSIGFYVVQTKDVGTVSAVKKEDIVQKSIFRKDEEVNIEAEFEAGTYNIVPCLFDANVESSFALVVYAEQDFDLLPLDTSCKVVLTKPIEEGQIGVLQQQDHSLVTGGGSEIINLRESLRQEKEVSAEDDVDHQDDDGKDLLPNNGSDQKKESKPKKAAKPKKAKDSKSGKTAKVPKASKAPKSPKGAPSPSPQQTRLSSTAIQGSNAPVASGSAHLQRQRFPWEIDFDEVEILEKIGQGGFGVVYKGMWRGTTVAVKKLIHEEMDENSYQEFVKEIEIMSKLRHPQVVLFLAACLTPPHICILTEFLERGNLAEVLKDRKLSWRTKVTMACNAAQGMNYLHQSKPKVVHRDLKSLNLLVDENYHVKVADFGLSKVSVTGNTLNSKVGSLNWCAPEILLQSMPYTDKADVYSFGMVLWELLTHEAPFSGMHPLQIVRAIDQGKLPDIPAHCPSPDYAKLIQDCWEKDPDKRPAFDVILMRLKRIEREAIDAERQLQT